MDLFIYLLLYYKIILEQIRAVNKSQCQLFAFLNQKYIDVVLFYCNVSNIVEKMNKVKRVIDKSNQLPPDQKLYNINLVLYTNPKCSVNGTGLETGLIFQYIYENYDRFEKGMIDVIIFNHAHEMSWHCDSLSQRLERILLKESRDYLVGNDLGALIPIWTDHPAPVKWRGFSIIYGLSLLTNNTNFFYFNRSNNNYKIWRCPLSCSFFLSKRAVLQFTKNDYSGVLKNLPNTISKTENHFVGNVGEYGMQVLFTNKSWPELKFQSTKSLGPIRLLSYVNQNRWGTLDRVDSLDVKWD